MSFYGGIEFFICLLLVMIPAFLLGIFEKSIKYYSIVVSAAFICLVLFPDVRQLMYLIAFYVIELALIKAYLFWRTKYGRKQGVYYAVIILSIIPLALCKISEIVPMHIFQFLGISYLTFRVVQIIIETYDGVIKEVKIIDFTAFLLFFPTISSGPIDRSRRFGEDLYRIPDRAAYLNLAGDGLYKILLGISYKFVIAAMFYKFMGFFEANETLEALIGYSYCYGFYLFFDFAGYSLMAVGSSYMLGICTPDNFNKPFISRDIKEFWDRWHISLSYWFRDFLFSRFTMLSVKKKWFHTRLQRASAGFIVNMAVMGVWHGLSPHYIVYGLYHGVLLALTEVYQKKSGFYKKNKQKKWYQIGSWFITMQFVMFGFLIFSGRLF